MLSRVHIGLACALGFTVCGLVLHAEPDSKARAQVFSRDLLSRARLTFEWDSRQKVPFSMRHNGNQVILHFDRPVRLNWGSSLEAIHAYVGEVETADNGQIITLTLNRPVHAQHLYDVDRDESDNGNNGLDLIPVKKEKVKAEPHITMNMPDSYNAPSKKQKHEKTATRKQRKPTALAAKAKPIRKSTGVIQAQNLSGLAPAAGKPTPSAAAPPAAAPPAPVIETEPVQQTAPIQATPASAPAAAIDKAILPLAFKPGEAFAVFTLHDRLWIVSENIAAMPSPDAVRKAGEPLVKDVQTLSDPHAAVVILELDKDVSASVEKTSADQTSLLLAHASPMLSQSFLPALNSAGGKTSLVIPAGKTAQLLSLRDPQTGNTLSVVPVAEPGAGLKQARSFVEFNLLQSAQGIAVQGLADGLTVRLQQGAVEIASPAGLAVSPEIAQQLKELESEVALAHLAPTLFPYARWKLDDEKNYVPEQIKLFHEIAYNKGEKANKARLKLLGLYLGEGLFPEALSMSDDILRSSLKFYRENKVSALRGAANFFLYRIAEAERDFSAPELANDKEAAQWRTLASELLGESKETFSFPANYEPYISHYPPSFISKLAVIAADRSIARKDYDNATAIFDTIKKDGYDEPVKKYVEYMRAKIFSETRSESEAVKIWEEQAKDLSDPLIRARAEFSLVNLLLKNDKITHEDAIKRLERLRIVWRGDSLELGALTLLGNLYLQEKQYANALHTMRDIVLYYPQVLEALTTARQMEETFVTLYNKDGAKTMPPLDAMALFYEFRDLVPLGAAGDQMIRNLAERLVSIDLLDRAAALLEHQIKNRLQGEERSRVGARLAQIYLLNHQSNKALETLKTTGYGALAPALQLERVRLTAQALAQQGKLARAVEVISADNSPEGTLLKLSIYWDSKDWPNVVSMAEDILGNRNDPSAPLTPVESDVLLKLATAYVYEHDAGQLQYLRDYFTPLMKDNPKRESFLFITTESGAVDYDNLANIDQDINAVRAFLNTPDRPTSAPSKTN